VDDPLPLPGGGVLIEFYNIIKDPILGGLERAILIDLFLSHPPWRVTLQHLQISLIFHMEVIGFFNIFTIFINFDLPIISQNSNFNVLPTSTLTGI